MCVNHEQCRCPCHRGVEGFFHCWVDCCHEPNAPLDKLTARPPRKEHRVSFEQWMENLGKNWPKINIPPEKLEEYKRPISEIISEGSSVKDLPPGVEPMAMEWRYEHMQTPVPHDKKEDK